MIASDKFQLEGIKIGIRKSELLEIKKIVCF